MKHLDLSETAIREALDTWPGGLVAQYGDAVERGAVKISGEPVSVRSVEVSFRPGRVLMRGRLWEWSSGDKSSATAGRLGRCIWLMRWHGEVRHEQA